MSVPAAPPGQAIIALVGSPEKAKALADKRVQVLIADFTKPDTLPQAFTGAKRILLISSSELELRIQQHKNVVDAAKACGAQVLAYTSILHADTATLALAADHKATEDFLQQSGLPFVFLRNPRSSRRRTVRFCSAI